jgi:hypothetical protein
MAEESYNESIDCENRAGLGPPTRLRHYRTAPKVSVLFVDDDFMLQFLPCGLQSHAEWEVE